LDNRKGRNLCAKNSDLNLVVCQIISTDVCQIISQATGDRIRFTRSNWEQRIRSGDFATVERIAEDNSIAVRLDSDRAAQLNPEKARHIDYGYVVDGNQRFSADRVLATGENLEAAALSNLSPYTRDLSVYTSDSTSIQPKESILAKDTSLIQAVESTLPGLESFELSR
jgi:hypothetical protein